MDGMNIVANFQVPIPRSVFFDGGLGQNRYIQVPI